MKFIRLPSGLIVNMAQVAYIEEVAMEWTMFFSAAASFQGAPETMHLKLNKADADAVFRWLASTGGMSPVA